MIIRNISNDLCADRPSLTLKAPPNLSFTCSRRRAGRWIFEAFGKAKNLHGGGPVDAQLAERAAWDEEMRSPLIDDVVRDS